MKVETPKPRAWSEVLLSRAVEFHGHGGPFMVVGLRMGLTALERLDANGWFDLRCRVRLQWRPPESCVIDGIQSSTGCTMGKNNIEVEEGGGIEAEFTDADGTLKIALKREMLQRIRGELADGGEEGIKRLMDELIEAPADAIFDMSPPAS